MAGSARYATLLIRLNRRLSRERLRIHSRLALLPAGPNYALVWGDPGFTLERAESVNGPWSPVAVVSPMLVPATNPAAFFRLRR